MSTDCRANWAQRVQDVVRSRHYTWLGLGLGGEELEDAMATLVADILHICRHNGIEWEDVVEQGRAQFEEEESMFASEPRGSVG